MKRILSIDGGGIRGVFPASFLSAIEETINDKICNYFDLIAGTSTGGIIALGLGLGMSAKDILGIYEDDGPRIFGGSRLLRGIRRLGLAKYSSAPLEDALQEVFEERRLGESQTRLVIPSLNLENGEVHVYKTAHHPRFEHDYRESVVNVALATASAPTYFPAHRSSTGTPLVDGGMWANNPSGMSVVEAIGVLHWAPQSIRLLSLGCTSEPLNIGAGRKYSLGLTYWGLRIANVFMAGQSSASLGTAKLLLGGETNIYRIDPVVPSGRFGLDVSGEITSLKGLGHSEARKEVSQLREPFFKVPVDEFLPYWNLNDNKTEPRN